MPSTLDWKSSEDPRDIVHIIVQALVEGKLVVFPSETCYVVVASALNVEATFKLLAASRRRSATLAASGRTNGDVVEERLGQAKLLLRSPQEALDYAPELSPVAARMISRGWPGPLCLEIAIDGPHSLLNELAADVRMQLCAEERFLPMRVAAHNAIAQTLRLIPGPLVAAPVLQPDGSACCLGSQAALLTDGLASAVIDDGETHFAGLTTCVRVNNNVCELMEPGVVDFEKVNRLSQLAVLLVCTGNTCRSPMAEVLMRNVIEKRFPEIAQRQPSPYLIASAGLSAFPGGPPSTEATAVMERRGLSLADHQSRSVTEHSLRHADLVLTMTGSHRSAIVDRLPGVAEKVQLLSGSSADVSDPFGGSESVYAACADQIEGYLKAWAERIEESWFPDWRLD